MRARVWIAAVALLSGGCKDNVYAVCGQVVDPDWHGMKCFMQQNCVSCHGERDVASNTRDLLLPDDVAFDVVQGWGVFVIPGDSEASLLWRMISWTPTDNGGECNSLADAACGYRQACDCPDEDDDDECDEPGVCVDTWNAPMPYMYAEPLPADVIAPVKQWIDDGAIIMEEE